MSRVRAFLLLTLLSGLYFSFLLFQQSISGQNTVLSFLPILTLLLGLLTLVISPRAIALYAISVIFLAICAGVYEVINSDANTASRFISTFGVLLFLLGLTRWLSQLKKVQWVKVQRFSTNEASPWVLLDQGTDPTIGFDKEEK
jgi:hypothetical protein